jgi:hypothetical protein
MNQYPHVFLGREVAKSRNAHLSEILVELTLREVHQNYLHHSAKDFVFLDGTPNFFRC